MTNDLLSIYLNDHLAGSSFGVELARRTRDANRGNDLGGFLDGLAREIEADRVSLERIMDSLGVRRSEIKVALGWLAEKIGRIKPNGRVRSYSPLSRVLELEALQGGVRAKLSLWLALREISTGESRLDDTQVATLVERAERQLEGLRDQLRAAAATAFIP